MIIIGLDNGLVVRAKTLKASQFLEEGFLGIKDNYSENAYELGYWRKCWNVRGKVLDTFENKGYDGQGGDINLTLADLVTFRDVMKYFLIEENWHGNENGFALGSIWTWAEAVRGIANTIFWITEFLENVEMRDDLSDEDFEIFFYDSY